MNSINTFHPATTAMLRFGNMHEDNQTIDTFVTSLEGKFANLQSTQIQPGADNTVQITLPEGVYTFKDYGDSSYGLTTPSGDRLGCSPTRTPTTLTKDGHYLRGTDKTIHAKVKAFFEALIVQLPATSN